MCREHLGRKALSSAIDGRNLEAIHAPWLQGDVTRGSTDALPVIPTLIVGSRVEHITLGHRRGLSTILGGSPREAHLVGIDEVNGKGMYGKRLDGILGVVHLGRIVQYTFIYGSRGDELEVRVVSIAHIGKVLVREQLDDARGYIGEARFAVVLVP